MDDRTVVQEARAALGDVLEWRATVTRWELIDGILDAMASAVAAADLAALADATADLELISPIRFNRAGDPAGTPPSKDTHDRVNHLIHSLDPDKKQQPAANDQQKK